MNSDKKIISTLLILLNISLLPFFSHATHLVGGELNYRHQGGNNYEIKLTVYRDCYNGVAPFDDPAYIGIFDGNNNIVDTLIISLFSSTSITDIGNSCSTTPSYICYEIGAYIGTINLPPIASGYQLVYQRCCRPSNLLNISSSGSVGSTYFATIPGTALSGNNSNPIFKPINRTFICANEPFAMDFSATDLDGDSLAYSLYTPYQGADNISPQPIQPSNPPYSEINWQSPYSLTDVLGGSVPLSINSQNGLLTGTPGTIGVFAYGVIVKEYRNGIFLGETKRDFQIYVINGTGTSSSDLKAYYPFKGNSNDESGLNHGSLIGSPTLTSDRFGFSDCAYQFPGTATDYIQISNSNDFNIFPTGALSISLWYQGGTNNVGDYEILFRKSDSLDDYHLDMFDVNRPIFGNKSFSLWSYYPRPIPDPLWHHVVGVYDNKTWFLYENDTLRDVDTSRTYGITMSTGDIIIGKYFSGKIDDIKFYNRALTNSEIHDLFTELSSCDPLGLSKHETQSAFNVYPNPSKGIFNIDYNGNSLIRAITVFDITGKEMIRIENLNQAQQSIDLSKYHSGLYLIKVITDEYVQSRIINKID